ncbi:cell division protein FtsA [Clostridiales bacterium oral taxon 876 str. F0540]|nr:cell division protein FtsA [Clostridiales bacterium oral taxon 876 str. F0540]
MELTNINPKDIIFALDIGTRSLIGTVGIVKEKKFHCIAEQYLEHEERAMLDGQIHDINLVAIAVNNVKKSLEQQLGFKLNNVAIAAAGRFLRTSVSRADLELDTDREIDKDIIRSLELTAVKSAEQQINKQLDGKLYCVGYSVKNYYLNDYVISNLLSHKGDKISVEVIATFLPRSVVESLYAVMSKVNLNVINLTLEPIAAMEAAIPQSLRLLNLALIDIGAGTSDIAISSKDSISAYGMVSTAGDEVTEAIAQSLLVDFNTAEKIKRVCVSEDTITYVDVLGLENEIKSQEVLKIIHPVVDKICEEIASKVIELNGGKAPNAVFLVGGGAHTPNLKDTLAQKLNLPMQRIAIKGRDAVTECVCIDNELGSTGVTVLGIALVSIMRLGHDFIDVTLNGKVISLFNSHKHTVSDVMVQAGINPKVLIGRNGKSIRFVLNGGKRISFGSLATNAEIKINNILSNIDSEVKEGDNIEIEFARDGMDASPKIYEFIQKVDALSFYVNDILQIIEPKALVNGVEKNIDTIINDGDDISIIFAKTIKDYKTYFDKEEGSFFIDGKLLQYDYVIQEGDRIYKEATLQKINTNAEKNNEPKEDIEKFDNKAGTASIKNDGINIIVNNEKVYLQSKDKYIFIDVFDHIDFDLTRSRGNLILLLNNSKAGYYDELKDGDKIEIYWE